MTNDEARVNDECRMTNDEARVNDECRMTNDGARVNDECLMTNDGTGTLPRRPIRHSLPSDFVIRHAFPARVIRHSSLDISLISPVIRHSSFVISPAVF